MKTINNLIVLTIFLSILVGCKKTDEIAGVEIPNDKKYSSLMASDKLDSISKQVTLLRQQTRVNMEKYNLLNVQDATNVAEVLDAYKKVDQLDLEDNQKNELKIRLLFILNDKFNYFNYLKDDSEAEFYRNELLHLIKNKKMSYPLFAELFVLFKNDYNKADKETIRQPIQKGIDFFIDRRKDELEKLDTKYEEKIKKMKKAGVENPRRIQMVKEFKLLDKKYLSEEIVKLTKLKKQMED